MSDSQTISMTVARKILAEKQNCSAQSLNNKQVIDSGLFEIISGPDKKGDEYSISWKLKII